MRRWFQSAGLEVRVLGALESSEFRVALADVEGP